MPVDLGAAPLSIELPNVQIVVLSMHDSQDMERTVRVVGACDYLSKRCTATMLLQAIRRAADRAHERSART